MIEKFKQLFDALGIGYEEFRDGNETCLELRAQEHSKVDGYAGFASTYWFDKNGDFMKIDIWE